MDTQGAVHRTQSEVIECESTDEQGVRTPESIQNTITESTNNDSNNPNTTPPNSSYDECVRDNLAGEDQNELNMTLVQPKGQRDLAEAAAKAGKQKAAGFQEFTSDGRDPNAPERQNTGQHSGPCFGAQQVMPMQDKELMQKLAMRKTQVDAK